jgi:hypothetical protein
MTPASAPVNLPVVRRTKDGLDTRFGDGRLLFSRRGGVLHWLDESGASRYTAELKVVLATPSDRVDISQSLDTDPRLVIGEQGPVRCVLRALFDLLDPAGRRWGEGLTEWTAYADGVVAGVVSLRLINADEDVRLLQAAMNLTGPAGSAARGIRVTGRAPDCAEWENPVRFDATTAGAMLGPKDAPRFVVAWRSGKSVAYDGGKGPWQGFGDRTPYYEDWGTLPDQGWGDSGWNTGRGAGARYDDATGLMELAFVRSDQGEPLPPVHALQGSLLCLCPAPGGQPLSDRERDVLMRTVADWRSPGAPETVGAEYRGYSVHDAAHMVYAPDARSIEISLPSTGAPSTVHIYGLSHWGGWNVTCGGVPLIPQLVNDGLGCDDPNGLQLGRFDDRHGPIIGRTDTPANRMILRAPAGRVSGKVKIRAVEGLGLSYLHWDDRQMYLVQSSANTKRNQAELVVRDGKLRRLVAPHSDEVSIAAIPLYWYQCNTPTPYMAADEVTRCAIVEAGPDAIAFDVMARNRYGCADSAYRVIMPFDRRLLRVDVTATLTVHREWHFKDLQLLNLFAEEYRDHRRWPHESAMAMDRSGKLMIKRPHEGRNVAEGEFLSEYVPPLLFSLYTASRGNVFLAQTVMTGPVQCQHFLCPHWIDSHFHVVSPTGKLDKGDRVNGAYSLVVDDGRALGTPDIEAIARAVVSGVPLVEALNH